VSSAATRAILLGLISLLDVRDAWRQTAARNKAFLLLGDPSHYAMYEGDGMRWHRCLTRCSLMVTSGRFGLLVFLLQCSRQRRGRKARGCLCGTSILDQLRRSALSRARVTRIHAHDRFLDHFLARRHVILGALHRPCPSHCVLEFGYRDARGFGIDGYHSKLCAML